MATTMLIKASRPNRLIFPRIKSDTRGCVTPSSLAAWAWRWILRLAPKHDDVRNHFGGVFHIQFLHDAAAVDLHGAVRDV